MGDQLHHHVTQYYLRSWCRPPEFEVMPAFRRNSDGSVTPFDELSPKVTGAEINLYELTNVDPERRHFLEKDFFTPVVDDPGHHALRKLIDEGVDALTDQERFAWTVYMNAASLRTPDMVRIARAEGPAKSAAEFTPEWYEGIREPGHPVTVEEYLDRVVPGFKENVGLIALKHAIMSEKLVEPVLQMEWMTLDLSGARFPLLTSDRPIWASAHPSNPRCIIVMPVSPTKLFLATHRANVPSIRSKAPDEFVAPTNRTQCMNAQRWVYGAARLRFVQNHIRR